MRRHKMDFNKHHVMCIGKQLSYEIYSSFIDKSCRLFSFQWNSNPPGSNWKKLKSLSCKLRIGRQVMTNATWEFGLNKFASLSGSSESEKESKAGTYNNTKALEQNPLERLVQSVRSSGMKCLLHLIYVLIYDWFRSSRLCCNFSKCILTVACCDTVPQLKTRFGPQVSSKCCRFLPGNPDESKCLDSQAKEPASKYSKIHGHAFSTTVWR